MSNLTGKRVGVAICASCCTYNKIISYVQQLVDLGADVIPIMSVHAQTFDTRFGDAKELINKIEKITGKEILRTITEVEPIGPKRLLDVLIILPCTGNSLAKLANGITDTPVTLSAKSMLRNQRPVIISLATNDALGINMKNIGILLNTKNIYFVPLGQDNYKTKPNSMIANLDLLIPTVEAALEGKQIQPVLIQYK